ncbi:MAG TPA: hypothetical protein VHL57_06935 [Flavobacteriales bacterium]|nr:hypothetical protein [Flavobacteriales bacterium]
MLRTHADGPLFQHACYFVKQLLARTRGAEGDEHHVFMATWAYAHMGT